jgi:hypothetical protein
MMVDPTRRKRSVNSERYIVGPAEIGCLFHGTSVAILVSNVSCAADARVLVCLPYRDYHYLEFKMAGWHQLRQIIALLCIVGIVLVAVHPGNPGMLVAAIDPVFELGIPTTCPSHRVDAERVHNSFPPCLAALADRAPPVRLMEVL